LALSDVDIRKNPLEGCVAALDSGGAAASPQKITDDKSYSDSGEVKRQKAEAGK
jgi:hypothetical protein